MPLEGNPLGKPRALPPTRYRSRSQGFNLSARNFITKPRVLHPTVGELSDAAALEFAQMLENKLHQQCIRGLQIPVTGETALE